MKRRKGGRGAVPSRGEGSSTAKRLCRLLWMKPKITGCGSTPACPAWPLSIPSCRTASLRPRNCSLIPLRRHYAHVQQEHPSSPPSRRSHWPVIVLVVVVAEVAAAASVFPEQGVLIPTTSERRPWPRQGDPQMLGDTVPA